MRLFLFLSSVHGKCQINVFGMNALIPKAFLMLPKKLRDVLAFGRRGKVVVIQMWGDI